MEGSLVSTKCQNMRIRSEAPPVYFFAGHAHIRYSLIDYQAYTILSRKARCRGLRESRYNTPTSPWDCLDKGLTRIA